MYAPQSRVGSNPAALINLHKMAKCKDAIAAHKMCRECRLRRAGSNPAFTMKTLSPDKPGADGPINAP